VSHNVGVKRALRPLSTVLVVVGALLLVDAGLTLLWQEPVSALYSRLQQGRLDDRLARLEGTEPTALDRRVLSRLGTLDRRVAYAARALDRRTEAGDPLGRIRMPAIGVSTVVVAGTDAASLRLGPGHYPGTPLPGARGTVAIAGHRTTYGAPFRKLDRLRSGDRVEVAMPYGTFVYEVRRRRIVAPTATWVTRNAGFDQLILSACHPLYSAAQRIVVFARLVDARPKGERLA
jgi:sortase A